MRKLLYCFLFIFNSKFGTAQINLDSALNIIDRNNISLQIKKQDLAIFEVEKKYHKISFIPDLTTSIYSNQNYGLIFDQTSGTLVKDNDWTLNSGANANLNLQLSYLNLTKYSSKSNSLRNNYENLSYAQQGKRLKEEFIVLFYDYFMLKDIHHTNIKNDELQKREFSNKTKLYDLGKTPLIEVNMAGKNLEISLNRVIDSKLSLDKALLRIKNILSVKDSISLTCNDCQDEFDVRKVYYSDINESSNLDMYMATSNISILENNLRQQILEKLPKINLNLTYGSSVSSRYYDYTGNRLSYFDQFNDNKYFLISANLSMPIFNKSLNKNIKLSRLAIKSAELQKEKIYQELQFRNNELLLELNSLFDKVNVNKKLMTLYSEQIKSLEKLFDFNKISYYELLRDRDELYLNMLELKRSKYSLLSKMKIFQLQK